MYVKISSKYAEGPQRLDRALSTEQLRKKLETLTGIPPKAQGITAFDENGHKQEFTSPDQLRENWELKVSDERPEEEQLVLEDVSKYEMQEAEYAKLPGTLREYKKQHQLGRFAKVGGECTVRLSCGEKAGVIAFIGHVDELPDGEWVGVELFEPVGKNDGSLEKRYFTAKPNHGVFVRPSKVFGHNEAPKMEQPTQDDEL